MNYRAVSRTLGVVLLLTAAFMLMPLAVAIGFGERSAIFAFLWSAVITAAIGGVFAFIWGESALGPDGRPRFYRREGLATVGLAWTVCGIAGALPYLFLGTLPSVVDAVFESVSGFTTTGSTVMSPETIDGMPSALAIWRSFSQWLGGFGIVMVFVVLFPTGGRSLFRSEVPGIRREAGHSRVRDSALALMKIYLGLSAALVATLVLMGLSGMDAFIHTFSTISNGGFSNHSESIAHFDSAAIELVLASFMLLAAFNFALYDSLFRAGIRNAWGKFVGSLEAKLFVGVVVGATLLIALSLWLADDGASQYASPVRALRDSYFQVVCIVTTAGYATADFDGWPQLGRVVLAGLAITGACAGSTSGGLKLVRIAVVVKGALVGVRRFARPRVIHQVRMDGQSLDERTVSSVMGFVMLWAGVVLVATAIVASFGTDLETSASAAVAALNNVGPGFGAVGPAGNFGHLDAVPKIVLSLCMILGRLEFYAFVVLVMPSFWRR